jgi:hypothetical protein
MKPFFRRVGGPHPLNYWGSRVEKINLKNKMKKLISIFAVSLIAVGLLAGGWGCQDKESDVKPEENDVTAQAPTPVVTPVSSPSVTEIKTPEYTSEGYNYKLTLPTGYTAVAESSASGDKVIIYDKTKQVFATIWTPILETGFEVWDIATEKTIAVPGSTTSLVWQKMLPDKSAGSDTGKVVVTWGDPEKNYEATGMIVHDFDPAAEASLKTFEEMIKTLRFI